MSTITPIAAGVRRLTAPNPGPMTATGTQTYILGEGDIAVIDPGPASVAHSEAILELGRVSHILVTHAHLDHSGGVAALVRATSAPVLAFGPATAGRSELMTKLANRGGLAGGEGIDHAFTPDRRLNHGDRITGDGWDLTALHTPGHLSSHMCFVLEGRNMILSGDTVMGWSTTLISPPDGSVGAFLNSMDLLAARPEQVYLPGHGEPVEDGPARARQQAVHRRMREAQILEAVGTGASAAELTARIYSDVAAHLHPAAQRNVLAHLIDLAEKRVLLMPGGPLERAKFHRA
ncbi:MAG: MBL fold metallo-hydrolase [Pseudomonadota bacterium]